ncbi:hypothetical protein A2382_00130 [Candidatus Woesebacteria bacterium RIFOXYB1_FULL_38_16]|uniref:Methyltransferase type 11 domain-containing protein n=1 Tax=Candidatus Woesebacteria bacterium RIFOXYB1_FULL_38_16 TaxID=1802538 RepID=A0A1F8CV91_9BACT|nr:MAG: hypothetical protein A2191_00800 [Candidatus Woesebacteria bacterium RIFOXYA1_FULL_38_9]OGM80181.1 MAG: hypothetical protein A2382_00130 [Candidatus Woesebacteria bacterium RIFOXYB1_FULL_38_16]
MAAAYDKFDYPLYWKNRSYEHESEVLVLKEFLSRIPVIDKIIDIGCGFGRLTPSYIHRGKKILLTDASASLLALAREKYQSYRKVNCLQTKIEHLPKKLHSRKFSLALMIRVMHHIEDPDQAIKNIGLILEPRGYLILEFANKLHSKAVFKNICRGNLTFPYDIFPSDKRSLKNIKDQSIPFLNFHPGKIIEILKNNNFEILELRSVSNVRNNFLKENLPIEFLLWIEKIFQRPLAKIFFGPSIFVLARKI